MKWFVTDERIVNGKVTLTEQQQGPPNYAHGGASAALVDEAMGAAVWYAGHTVVAVNLNVNYLKPVPLHQEIEVTGHVTEAEEGEKVVKASGQITLPDGEVAVTANGTYVNAPQFFDKLIQRYFQG
jgi:uncharacterized protein (TIGR00369 family)